jgi:hypothetical protein
LNLWLTHSSSALVGQPHNADTDDYDVGDAAKQLPGRVIHCELNNNAAVVAPNPLLQAAAPWFVEASQDNVAQVVFYCKAGATRSPGLAKWYMQQVGTTPHITNQSVCLLSGGFGTWETKNGGNPGEFIIAVWPQSA